MNKEQIATNNAPKAIGPYSQGVLKDNVLYISGQIPINPKTGKMANDISNQTKQCLLNLKEILNAADFNLSDVLKTTVYLTDLSLFDEMNKVYGEFFDDIFPARSTLGVNSLPKGALIEIDLIASKN